MELVSEIIQKFFFQIVGVLSLWNSISIINSAAMYSPLGRGFNHEILSKSWGRGYDLMYLFRWDKSYVFTSILVLNFISSVMMAAGIAPHFMAGLLFLTLSTIQNRNPCLIAGGDSCLRVFLFLGAVTAPLETSMQFMAIKIQVCLIIVCTVFWKLQFDDWRKLTALRSIFSSPRFKTPIRFPQFILQSRLIGPITLSTLVLQVLGPVFLWIPQLSTISALALMFFHFTLLLFVNASFFNVYMIVGLALFLKS